MLTALSAGVAWILVQAHVSSRKQDCLQLGCLWGGAVRQLWGLLGAGPRKLHFCCAHQLAVAPRVTPGAPVPRPQALPPLGVLV